jgi:hypothetical protein
VVKDDLTLEGPRFARVRTLGHDHVGIEDLLNSLDRHRSLGDRVAHLGEILDRFEELAEVGEEHGQVAHGHGIGQDQRGAPIEHESGAQRGGHGDGG